MNKEDNYISINKRLWNAKVQPHVQSEFYDQENFLKGAITLKDIELKLLSDVKGKTILHLQCHFGQDTISLSRLGAIATGVDFSDRAIDTAKELAYKLHFDTEFICCDVYDLPNHLHKKFDIVFTSYGTIGWLPDMQRWAGIISHFLKPGGKFVFAEFHPVVWMMDYDFEKIEYNYFNDKAIVETESGTYANPDALINLESVGWNHSLSEVLNSLLEQGLTLNNFQEYDYSPYNCFKHTEEFEKGKYRIKHLQNKLPFVYSLTATKSR